MRLFRKGKTRIIAKFLWTDLVICIHCRKGETPSYSGINMVVLNVNMGCDPSLELSWKDVCKEGSQHRFMVKCDKKLPNLSLLPFLSLSSD